MTRWRSVLLAVLPVAAVALLGIAAAALGLHGLTFVLGAPTPMLAVVVPLLAVRSRADLSALGATSIAALSIALNLMVEAGASIAQVALLGL